MATIKKIKAFTLSEVVIVLILSSIVVGLSFSALRLVQKQMSAIQSNYVKSMELSKLDMVLWLDFNRFSEVSYETKNKELMFKNELDSISYRIDETMIIRDIDTFQISIDNLQLYKNGKEVKSETIDALKIETSKEFLNQKLFIYKTNGANFHMN